jgi:hypothetical protein
MAILMVVGAAGAVAKLASKFPELLRIAGMIGKGGELGDLVEVTEAGGGAAKAVEKGPEFIKVDDFGKPEKAAPVPPKSEGPPVAPPKPPPSYNTKPMNPHFQGEHLPGNKIWRGKQVKYLSDAERSAYKLEIRNGKIYDANGQLFDTGDALSAHSGTGRAIFVMDEHGNFYASKKQIVGGFHHSSLLAGQPVAAAGELQVDKGVIKVISDKSGHYTPGRQFSQQAIDSLQRSGVDTSAVQTDYIAPR